MYFVRQTVCWSYKRHYFRKVPWFYTFQEKVTFFTLPLKIYSKILLTFLPTMIFFVLSFLWMMSSLLTKNLQKFYLIFFVYEINSQKHWNYLCDWRLQQPHLHHPLQWKHCNQHSLDCGLHNRNKSIIKLHRSNGIRQWPIN